MHKKGSMHISMNSIGLLSVILIFMGLILAVTSSSTPSSYAPSGFAAFEQPPAKPSPVPEKATTPIDTVDTVKKIQDNNNIINLPNKIQITTGKNSIINAQVKNINSDTKTDVSIELTECLGTGTDITINQNPQTIPGGEISNYILQISSGNTDPGSYECTVKAISSKYQILGIKKVTFIVQ